MCADLSSVDIKDVADAGHIRRQRDSCGKFAEKLTAARGARSIPDVSDIIERAKTGRAKCRGCGVGIASGELRFGEAWPNAYGEGEALTYYHLRCAACFRPEKFLPCFQASEHAGSADADWLTQAAEAGVQHPRLPRLVRAERAASGRARCRHCQELQEKGSLRLALHIFEEGRFSPAGTVHVACAPAYFGTKDLVERLKRLTPELDAALAAEVEQQIAQAPEPDPTSGSDEGPSVARVREADDETKRSQDA